MVNSPLIRPAISGGEYVALGGGWLTSHSLTGGCVLSLLREKSNQ